MGFLGADSVEFNAFCQLFCFLCVHFFVLANSHRTLSATNGLCSKKRKRTGECAYTLICIDADSGYHTVDRSEQDRSGLVLEASPK